jgi:hypothetical protein
MSAGLLAGFELDRRWRLQDLADAQVLVERDLTLSESISLEERALLDGVRF